MTRPKIGLVLSGGGVRGAYEVGILAGIFEALDLRPSDRCPFDIFAGTSVGAINAAFLVANAHRGDAAVEELCDIWRNLSPSMHLRLNVRRSSGDSLVPRRGILGRSFIDARPLELLVRRSANWAQLNANVDRGLVSALLIAAFDIGAGRTTIFAQLSPGTEYQPTLTQLRKNIKTQISADHVLASAAIPLLFPARKIGERYYCDGGVRFNTPMAPAIRAGADKLVVISLQRPEGQEEEHVLSDYPSAALILGKLLNSLLLDPFRHDMAILARFNTLMHVLEDTLTPQEIERIHQVLEKERGSRYRRLESLLFEPSDDIGRIAGEHLRTNLDGWNLSSIPRFLLRRASRADATWEADWAAYLMFDGAFASHLIDLGLADARGRRDEIRAFFGK